ncbi:MAG TPA: RnfH family protein [Caldimonas sp.]|jgi:putative ubiquitin-RnfH superfamily antitoxin RatB of RatAB toxin-antitoxin module|nr:RnfH family protein [Caldimonas sp.]HEX2541680.1 RnfH family protein [Caldimonas sp.]
MSAGAGDGAIRVAVAFSAAPGEATERQVRLRPGSTVADALRESGVLEQLGAHVPEGLSLGVWGRPCAADTLLADGDRVEVWRPLAMDPKEARRLRASRRPKRPR